MSLPDKPRSLRVGCVGGGQLGRMMAIEAPRLNISMSFLDPGGQSCPAAHSGATHSIDEQNNSNKYENPKIIQGSLSDKTKLEELSKGCNVVTVEIEHVGVDGLKELEKKGVNVQPSSRVIEIIQDKFIQKTHFANNDIPLPAFMDCPTMESIINAASTLGLPLMLKSRKGGYDGKGNAVLNETSDEAIEKALALLFGSSWNTNVDKKGNLGLYAEKWVHYTTEIAVMVVRSTTGETRSYPAVTAIQTNSICRVVLAPARNVSPKVRKECERVASRAIDSLGKGATGMFGVELFLVQDTDQKYQVLLNEVAPRPHNTGHYTQDACTISQFENHLRAVCGLPLGDCDMIVGAAASKYRYSSFQFYIFCLFINHNNLLTTYTVVNILGASSGSMSDTMTTINGALSIPRCSLHWYGKEACRAGRKMGHVNITAHSPAELDKPLKQLLQLENIPNALQLHSAQTMDTRQPPLVGIIMGSSSDLPTMQAAVNVLRKKPFEIACEVDIVSAHRTPEKLMNYARSASSRGIQVIIAGAGGAAHLPGMVASMTPLPVIGVPIKTSTLNGQDSLLSIVQMPRGIPVATVAIGNAMNAGLLAARILGSSRVEIREAMEEYQKGMKEMVEGTSDKLLQLGSEAYLEGMENKNTSVNV